ncbi:MAG: hypothetical protein FJ395_16005 [Verrucomicrobia bacterium]|nr:hypothetical protein [Verrucomicrobiota bacterium]
MNEGDIALDDPEFPASGLKAVSLFRLGFLAVLSESVLLGRIGGLSSARRQRLLTNLCRHLATGNPTSK